MLILSLILAFIFFILGSIHFYWALDGKWGFEQALPVNEEGEKILNPGAFESAFVGIFLSLFGCYYLIQAEFIQFELANWLSNILSMVLPTIFMLRAFGDFKYVGFFKKIENTEFAKWDSTLFSPLCLFIGIIGIIIS